MIKTTLSIAALSVAALAQSAAAAAQSAPTLQGTYSDWMVYTRGSGSARVCYAVTKPIDQVPKSVNHGDVYFLVSTWQNGQAEEQPNFMAGYGLRLDRPAEAKVGSSRIQMYNSQNEAFVEDSRDEDRLVRAMKAGSVMRLSATSERGTATAYEFSLKGVTAAIRKTRELCG